MRNIKIKITKKLLLKKFLPGVLAVLVGILAALIVFKPTLPDKVTGILFDVEFAEESQANGGSNGLAVPMVGGLPVGTPTPSAASGSGQSPSGSSAAGSAGQSGTSPTAAPTAVPTTPPPASGSRPTAANTGPRYALANLSASDFYTSRTCNRQRIVGDVRIDQQWMKGETFTLTDCEITGTFWVYISSGTVFQLNEMPVINMDYVDIGNGMVTLNAARMTADHTYINGGTQLSIDDVWAPFVMGPAPFIFSNSVFYGPYFQQPTHAEPLHVGDYGSGYHFNNVAFLQQSGSVNNSGITAAINFHGMDAVFDGCWFVWDGAEAPAYYTAYFDAGGTSVVKNSKFSAGAANYIYPTSTYNPTFINNTDVDTGAPVNGI